MAAAYGDDKYPEGSGLTMEILDRHVELATWAESEEAVEYLTRYVQSQIDHETDPRLGPFDQHPRAGEFYAEQLSEQLGMGETYWVSHDMTDVIEQAHASLDELPLRARMIPAQHGLVQFARTIVLGVDANDEPWGVTGFSWSVRDEKDGGIVWYDANDQERENVTAGIFVVWWMSTREAAEIVGDLIPTHVPWAFPAHITGWAFDLPWDSDHMDEGGMAQRKLLYTTLAMLTDEIVKVWKERAPRGAARRAERKLHTPEPGDVRIVDLRKVRVIGKPEPELGDGGHDDGEVIMWTHRWWSRGHMRTYHRGDAEKEFAGWVRGSVKGPSHLPIIYKDRLSRLIR